MLNERPIQYGRGTWSSLKGFSHELLLFFGQTAAVILTVAIALLAANFPCDTSACHQGP